MEKKVKPLHIPGTKVSVQNAQLLLSSGIQSLDEIIGGGLPIGTIVLVQEDAYCNYANFLLKYFLAEGVSHKHALFVASRDASTKTLVKELPKAVMEQEDMKTPSEEQQEKEEQGMKIAFRYKNLPRATPTKGDVRHYDLSQHLSPSELAAADVTHWDGTTEKAMQDPYFELLQSIYMTLCKRRMLLSDAPAERRSVLRVALHSLGSPSWASDNHSRDNRSLRKFFVSLRALVRQAFAVAYVTVPSRLWGNGTTLPDKCVNCSDVCVRLHSFAGTDLDANASLAKYHGFFYIDKIAAINSLTSKYQGPIDYAFKLLRKKFCIETLHLPPELQESIEREQDDGASVMCGSGSRRLLDF